VLTGNGTSLCSLLSDLFGEGVKCARKMLRFLKVSRVTHDILVENSIENKPALLAISEFEVASRECTSFFGRVKKNAAVNRDS
jgi:hypothetical protein